MSKTLSVWLDAFRVHQWVKQALIFLPGIALGDSIRLSDVVSLGGVALAFSLLASAIYLLNDINDLDQDRKDSLKKSRPLARGAISLRRTKVMFIVLVSTSIVVTLLILRENSSFVILLLLIYFLINYFYSRFHLKKNKLVGVLCVASGFPLRFSVGTVVLSLPFSYWAFVLIFQLSMFMLCGKRFQASTRVNSSFESTKNTDSKSFWLIAMVTFASLFIATYLAFVTDPLIIERWGSNQLILSVMPIGLGIVRFIEIVSDPNLEQSRDVTELMLTDKFLLLALVCFIAVMFWGKLSA
jgi:decaprenyl-phosphate phosphoribosyltransferase